MLRLMEIRLFEYLFALCLLHLPYKSKIFLINQFRASYWYNYNSKVIV
jgi:hypothetical protein